MKFALLGEDPRLFSLGRAVVRLGHSLAWMGETGSAGAAPPVPTCEVEDAPWERLLDGDLADVILVGPSTEEDHRVEQLRKFAQTGIPVLAVHPVCYSMLAYFELDMVRDETQCLMQHYTPGAHHPALDAMRRHSVDNPTFGRIDQIVFERMMSRRSKDDVLVQFVQDIDLVRALVGDVNRVATLASPDTEEAYGSLAVQMATSADLAVRWSVSPSTAQSVGRITLVGRENQAVLQMPADLTAWSLELSKDSAKTTEPCRPSDWDDPADAVERIVTAIENRRDQSTWRMAARGLEVADAVERSMQKGRTIELHFEQFSEQSTFRGLMTSIGCGLLMASLLIALVAGLVGDAFGVTWARGWHVVLLGLLVIFLLLQLVPRLVYKHDEVTPKDK